MLRAITIATLLMAPAAYAQDRPTAIQHGPDLEFVCASTTGQATSCRPTHPHYNRYMSLANWRFVGSYGPPGACVLGQTYGYGRHEVWVSADCKGAFRAPDLRYGDEYNAQRARL